MREPTFLVLSALADQPRHGYGVMREVEAMSAGRCRLKTSTLYAALDRLRVDGLVDVVAEEVIAGRLRRSYCLTDAGRERLTAEADRMRSRAREAQRRLALRPVTA